MQGVPRGDVARAESPAHGVRGVQMTSPTASAATRTAVATSGSMPPAYSNCGSRSTSASLSHRAACARIRYSSTRSRGRRASSAAVCSARTDLRKSLNATSGAAQRVRSTSPSAPNASALADRRSRAAWRYCPSPSADGCHSESGSLGPGHPTSLRACVGNRPPRTWRRRRWSPTRMLVRVTGSR